MFITIKHGDQQEALFNPDCSLVMLVGSIRRRCGSPHHLGVAVVDDSLKVQQLPEQSADNATSIFTESRGVYTLLAVKKRETGQVKYTVLLDDPDPELVRHLESLSNPCKAKPKAASQLKRQPTKQTLVTPLKKRTTAKLKGKG